MRARFGVIGGVVIALAGVGCGDDDGVPGGDAGGPDAASIDAGAPDATPAPTIEDVCDLPGGLFVEYVQKVLACNPAFQVFIGGIPTGTEISIACNGSLQQVLDDGTVTLGDDAAFAACRAYLDSATCATLEFDAPGPCDGIFHGTIAAGALCDSNDQCAGASYCDKSGGGTCGACAAQKADGASCTDGKQCQGRRCDANATCRTFGAAGDACLDRDDCLGDLRCDPGAMQCAVAPAWAVGSPCGDFLDCDSVTGDLICDPNLGTCQSYREVGQSCGGANGTCRFFEYQSCLTSGPGTGTCISAMVVADGQACGFFEGKKCMDGSMCRDHDLNPATADQCVRTKGLGEVCDPANSACDLFMNCVANQCQYGDYTGMCPAP